VSVEEPEAGRSGVSSCVSCGSVFVSGAAGCCVACRCAFFLTGISAGFGLLARTGAAEVGAGAGALATGAASTTRSTFTGFTTFVIRTTRGAAPRCLPGSFEGCS